jgi:hypothetical protein
MHVVSVEHALNGYVISGPEQHTMVVEVDESAGLGNSNRAEAFARRSMLYLVLEELGEIGSKHDKARVYIVVRDQDGNEIDDE